MSKHYLSEFDKFPIVDAHVHVHPLLCRELKSIMERTSLAYVVNQGVLELFDLPFEEGMREFRESFGDHLIYFTTPDFSDTSTGFGERMAKNLEKKILNGAHGLKIFKELGLRHLDSSRNLIAIDDARLDPLWEKAGELQVPVLIHSADPVAFFEPLNENNERWEELQEHPEWHFGGSEFPSHDALLEQRNRVIERHPSTTFIGAHLGNYPENLNYVDHCLDRFPNFNVDTSARIGEIGRHPAEDVRAFFLKHQDRILFGTDLIMGWAENPEDVTVGSTLEEHERFYRRHWQFFETNDPQIEHPFPIQGQWKVNAIGLPHEVLKKLYFHNAQRIIPGIE
ncbi:MAG: amidohydrolase family protein [Anaerolineales bacterium]|nr:amidohydrolase family protein [Anaerolineales bacterium]